MTTASTNNTATGNQIPGTVAKPSKLSMDPSDFIQMMLTQLQNQDPVQPTDSNALLQQMSAIGQMQSSTNLQTTLQAMTLQNQIGSASSLIGKVVEGTDATSKPITGVVNSVKVSQDGVSLELDTGVSLDVTRVTTISPAPATHA